MGVLTQYSLKAFEPGTLLPRTLSSAAEGGHHVMVPFHKGPQWCRLGQFAKSSRTACARAGRPWLSLHHSPVWAPSIHIIHSLWLWEGRGLAKVTKLVSCRAGAGPPPSLGPSPTASRALVYAMTTPEFRPPPCSCQCYWQP